LVRAALVERLDALDKQKGIALGANADDESANELKDY
jgi:hypothetical protein